MYQSAIEEAKNKVKVAKEKKEKKLTQQQLFFGKKKKVNK